MGIKKLHDLIKKYAFDVYEEVNIAEYAFEKIAIDLSLYMCKFKCVAGDRWINSFLNLVTCLRRNDVHCVFIFDSNAPPEKEKEREKRKESKENLKYKVSELEEALDLYITNKEVNSTFSRFYEKNGNINASILHPEKDVEYDIELLQDEIKKKKQQIIEISQEDIILVKQLFDILKIPYYQAPNEAETMCADLCKRGLVSAVLSEDTDVIAYGCPNFLFKIETLSGKCTRINYHKLLSLLDVNDEQFLDLCIMCGCDYNKNIPKIGFDRSYKFIQKYGNIENVKDELNVDVSMLIHERCRELFRCYEKDLLTRIPFCGKPDFNELERFMIHHKMNNKIENLKRAYTVSTNIVFLD